MAKKFDRPLLVRVDAALLKRLDALLAQRQRATPHSVMSRSSLVRMILWEAIERELERDESP